MAGRRVNRRDFLKNVALAGASVACIDLVGCGKEGGGDVADKAAGYAMKGRFEKDVKRPQARKTDFHLLLRCLAARRGRRTTKGRNRRSG